MTFNKMSAYPPYYPGCPSPCQPGCPPQCITKCVEACVRCRHCHEKQKIKLKVKIPSCGVAASAQLSANQAYTTTASAVLFNTVTLNETCFDPCNKCYKDPCSCEKKKKKKKHCSSGGCSSGSCGSVGCGSSGYGCNSTGPGYGSSCAPYCSPSGWPGNWWCSFYNPTTGLATVPPEGYGQYVIGASVEVDSAATSTVELRINGAVVISKTVGGVPGYQSVSLNTFQPLYPGQTVGIYVYDDTGAANVIGGASTNFTIGRIR